MFKNKNFWKMCMLMCAFLQLKSQTIRAEQMENMRVFLNTAFQSHISHETFDTSFNEQTAQALQVRVENYMSKHKDLGEYGAGDVNYYSVTRDRPYVGYDYGSGQISDAFVLITLSRINRNSSTHVSVHGITPYSRTYSRFYQRNNSWYVENASDTLLYRAIITDKQ